MKLAISSLVRCAVIAGVIATSSRPAAQNPSGPTPNKELEALHAHLEQVVKRRHDQLFEGITSVGEWERRKQATRDALAKMLWHDMRWPESPPTATVTFRQDHEGYSLENLVIETAPKVFLTANLYLPRKGTGPHPVVLYQCGHAAKHFYARHGAWFATHGIAALVMDNIEMGEIEFTHHGVYSRGWFHWYSRGFSPLAVELLNARRALDYLVTRSDIDRNRIGATGRSGGGMTTFFLAAIDERVRASAPVSGTLSTIGWIRDRLSMAHCDCQYPVNSYGLLYSEIGALVAPRPQLLVNADADRGFPMDAFNEMANKIGEVYRLYDATHALRTAITSGGHTDVEAIRLPVYSFFLEQLVGKNAPVVSEGPVEEPAAADLVCFRNGLPIDERLTRIDEELFTIRASSSPTSREAARPRGRDQLVALLRDEVFRYYPRQPAPLRPEWGAESTLQGRTVQKVSFTSFDGLRVKGTYSLPPRVSPGIRLPGVLVVDHRKGIPVWGNEQPLERNQWGGRAVLIIETLDRGSRALEQNLRSFTDDDLLHHMKREAMVAGTTLESMQVYEVLRSLEFLRSLPTVDPRRITILGKGEDGVNGLYAALLDGQTEGVILQSPPASHVQGPHYLGVLRYTDIAETAGVLADRVRVYGEVPGALRSARVCKSLDTCF
jgi:cephalosporin-C deacetylase-like acetyl esterase